MSDQYNNPRILVVDDYEITRDVTKEMLLNLGCEVDCAANAQEALQYFSRSHFNFILMDVMMPDIDGIKLTDQMRAKEPAGSHTPIIAFSAETDEACIKKCLDNGMDAYVTKPIKSDDLKVLLEKYSSNNNL